MFKKIIIIAIFVILMKYTIKENRKPVIIESSIKNTALVLNKMFTKTKDVNVKNEKALEEEIIELKKLLNLNEITSSFTKINATVISRHAQDFYEMVIIDKGKKDGIKENQAVVNEDGLIGKTIKVTNSTSHVLLLTNSNIYSKMSVSINNVNEKLYGILSGYDVYSNSFIIEGIDDMKKIKVGDLVSTTGLGNIFPNGLKVGKVVRITKDNYDLSYILKVEPSVNFQNFHYVAVLDRG